MRARSLVAASAWAAAPVTGKVRCTGDPTALKRLDISVAGEPAWGLYALPATQPKGLVAFFHGYTHTARLRVAVRRHADEASTTHVVGNTGFERLSAYFGTGETPHCREFVVDGSTRTMTQVPGTGGC